MLATFLAMRVDTCLWLDAYSNKYGRLIVNRVKCWR